MSCSSQSALSPQTAEFYKKFGFVETKVHPLKLILPIQDVLASMNEACIGKKPTAKAEAAAEAS
jgi:hypothetical protein